MKKTIISLLVIASLLITSMVVFADGNLTIISKITGLTDEQISELSSLGVGYGQLIPATIIAKRLDRGIKEIVTLREEGKSYYTIATENGITAEEFKSEMLTIKNAVIDAKVIDGTLTEDQANNIKAVIKARIDNCDGQNQASGCGFGSGMGFGSGKGNGQGRMMGNGLGRGRGQSNGQGCLFQNIQ